jgi:protein-arginine kinase activator protein McsA
MREAEEDRDREFPNGGPVLNHRPTDEELKTILMNTLEKCTITSIHQYYNSLLETRNKNVPFETIFEELRNLALTENKTSGAKRKADHLGGDKKERSKSNEATMAQVIAFLAYYDKGKKDKNPKSERVKCHNCGSDKHKVFACTSAKCGECNKTFKSVAERKAHWRKEHREESPKPTDDEEKEPRDPGADSNRKKQLAAKKKVTEKKTNRAKKENHPIKKKVRHQGEESSAADSELSSDDDSRFTTDDELEPNSS